MLARLTKFSHQLQPRLLPQQPLLSRVHRPFSTTTMASPKKYDSIVIGSGQAGTPLAGALAKAGHKTALIERDHIGGCCVNEGCTPTKTMIASGRAAYLTRRSADYGVHTPGGQDGKIAVDMLKVRQRKRDIVAQFRGGNESRTHAAGVDIVVGEARFTGPKTLAVKTKDGTEEVALEGTRIFINTGERPAAPHIPGIESVAAAHVLDSTSIQELDVVPGHLLVIGGGYVGLEFAQLFRRLGAEVTVVQRGGQLLGREDADVAACMADILREDGLTILLEAAATKVASGPSGTVDLTCRVQGGGEQVLSGTHILLAAGRVPNSDMLDLSKAGIATDKRGYIIGNEKLETAAEGVYVLGDVKGPPAFTHISYDDFRIIRNNLLGAPSGPASVSSTTDRLVPYVVYTDPQLGHVGLHEHEARARGLDVKVATMPMSYVARALETDESRGLMKGVVDAKTGKILGFTCLGIEGGEVMSLVQVAILGGVRYEVLREAVWAHPALAESLNNLWGFLK